MKVLGICTEIHGVHEYFS